MAPKFPTPRADEFLARLRERLPDKTLRHVCGVAEMMLRVREQAGITEEQAVTAGLLHDYCKAMKSEALLEQAGDYGMDIPPIWRENPSLLHGPVASEMVRRDLDITDADVLDAIYWHTTGRPNWNAVGLALYFSDFSEPNRPRPEAVEAREIFERDGFEAGLRYAAEAKLGYVEKKFVLDPTTAAFARWLREVWKP